jgi:hypothetical protein
MVRNKDRRPDPCAPRYQRVDQNTVMPFSSPAGTRAPTRIKSFIFAGIPAPGATEGRVLAPTPDCRQSSLGQTIKTALTAR